jgi:hypothetical protein
MTHCQGGEGPNTFDKMDVLEQWVEQGLAPNRIIASHATGGKVDRTRPLCAYPQVARHTGRGQQRRRREFRLQGAVNGPEQIPRDSGTEKNCAFTPKLS